MRRRIEQAMRVELAMNLDQQIAQLAQQPDRAGLIVGEGAAAAVRTQLAPQDQGRAVLGRFQALFRQQCESGVVGAQIERGGDGGGGGAFTDGAGIGAPAQSEAQRIQQDRLARSGLARQRGKPVLENEVELVDQNEIANRKRREHGPAFYSQASRRAQERSENLRSN